MIFDGLRNLVSGLGTGRDKSTASHYYFAAPDDSQLQAAYRTSWLAKKIIDIPAEDATREWREWQAETAEIGLIEAEEKRLGMQAKLLQALKLARLYGGAAIYIGTNDTAPEKPLRPDTIRRGGIEYLTVLSRSRVSAGDMQTDPRLPGYGQPSHYVLGDGVRVHPSRLVVLHGADVPDPDMPGGHQGWGDSVLTSTLEAITAVDAVAANIQSLTYEAKVDVVKIENFTEGLRQGGAEYENAMLARWRLAMTGKGINGTLMIDAAEEYEQKSASFSSLDAIWDRFMQSVAGAADIPMTRLYGQSPAGLNSTGEGDIRNYIDMVRSIQTTDCEPAMAILDECLIRSALGSRPEDVHYNWRSLWTPSAKERAEVADRITTAYQRVHEMDVLPPEAIGNAVMNALIENGMAPGLESDVEAMGGAGGPDDTEI